MFTSVRLFVLGAAALALPAGLASAATITVQNPSFESPMVTGNGGFYQGGTPDSWTALGFTEQYVERQDNGGFTGQPGITGANHQYIADNGSGILTQDLLVPFQPNTTYTVDLAGGHRNGFAGSRMEFGLRSTLDASNDLAGATVGFINENALTPPTFIYASNAGANGGVFTFTTGNTVPAGNLLAFIRGVTTDNSQRLHADGFSVTANPVPEPTSLGLLSIGGLAMLARRRKA